MIRFYFIIIAFLFVFKLLGVNKEAPSLQIHMGEAHIEGKITQDSLMNFDSLFITLSTPYSCTSRYEMTTISASKDGTFRFDIPVEFTTVISSLIINHISIPLLLSSDSILNLNIALNKDGSVKHMESNHPLLFSATDVNQWFVILKQMAMAFPDKIIADRSKIFNMTPENFVQFQLDYNLKPRLEIAKRDTLLSQGAKDWLSSMFSIFFIKQDLFQYKNSWERHFQNQYPDKILEENMIPCITRDYYSFLKQFNLNSSQSLYCFEYYGLLQSILSDKTLNLPAIGEMSIQNWQLQIKEILSPLVGFNDGLFYDLLTTNAFCRQFENELRPFSKAQIENIKAYYHDGEIAKILLARNLEIEKLASEKPPLVINKTPDVPKEKVLDAIVAKYRGKVVYIDLWATWCGPCLDAIQESRGVKAKMKDKNVVFVYLTNDSSPSPLWDEKIKGIGGEHYRLTSEQWEYLMDQSGFEAIPSYLYFDKEGKLAKKYTGYRGNLEVIETLNGLLQ